MINLKNRRQFLQVAGALGLAAPAFAQLGGLGKKVGGGAASGGGAALPMAADAFIKYIALSTNLGVAGTLKLLELYPPEKIAAIKEKCEKFNETQKTAKQDALDKSSLTLATQAAEEAAQLGADVAALDAEKTKALRAANAKLALCVVADGFAALNIKAYIDSLQNDIKSVSSNPTKAASAGALRSQLDTLTFVSTSIPNQVKAFTAIRGTAKKIAEAKKVTVPEDPKPESVSSVDSLEKAGTTADI